MSRVDPQRLLAAAVVALAALASTTACSPREAGSARPDGGEVEVVDALELECEEGLQQLDALIERRQNQPEFPPHKLHEARALRQAAGELFLSAAYGLALELMNEAFVLLEGNR